MITLPRIAFSLFVCFCLASCAPARADLSKHCPSDKEKPTLVFVKNVDYDQHGLPLFQAKLRKQPTKTGEQYTVAYFVKDRPVKSFDIVIVEQKINFENPVNVLYTWTGKGFDIGLTLGYITMEAGSKSGSKEAWIVLAVGAAMPIAGGVAGFVIGTLVIIPQGVQDLGDMLTTGREAIIGITEYEYDGQGRLKLMKMFQPSETPAELVRTVFTYEKNETIPSKTEVYSAPENKTRTIP
jgi:hypothetical protein